MPADLPLFIVEVYTPGEIVEARRSFSAATATEALLVAKAWLGDSSHDATNLRVVDREGRVMLDRAR
jgi:hypothetical protein